MADSFILEVKDFLNSMGIEHTFEKNVFFLNNPQLTIELCALKSDNQNAVISFPEFYHGNKHCRIYEDLWYSKGPVIRDILKANFNKGETIFARKCLVDTIDAKDASYFLNKNHLLGSARSSYRYCLRYNGEIVAVALFSDSRPMRRDDCVLSSYEWVRYASKDSVRVSGGMGKLLNHFIKEQRPEEIMSYSDADWVLGNAYEKLGFKKTGATAPVEFIVNKHSYERIPLKKLKRDNKYKSVVINSDDWVLISNSGNFKFYRRFPIF